jgi:serine/threonine protein kinase
VIKAYKDDRAYAVKSLIRQRDVCIDETQTRLFHHEASLLKQINHERIPNCIETFTFQQDEYMVQEYVHGDPLSSMMLKGYQFSEAEIIELTMQLLEILCYLHSQYIVHRDLRLGNLILNDGRLYLIDFGFARKYQYISDLFYLPDPIPRDASPAYLTLRRAISPRSDVFGVGLVAIDLMSNWFTGDAAVDPVDYPVSVEFQDFLKRLLKQSDGFVTAFEALQYLKNFRTTIKEIDAYNP